MTTIATKIEFDLTTKTDLERLRRLQEDHRYTKSDSVEYMCQQLEIDNLVKTLDIDNRRSRNLQAFNAELYSHGVRQWAYRKSFMVSMPAVHKKREKEFGIYVPMWAVSDHFRMPGACGNSNQRQLGCNIELFFPPSHEGKVIEINHENGAYSAYLFHEAPFTPSSDMKYWLSK